MAQKGKMDVSVEEESLVVITYEAPSKSYTALPRGGAIKRRHATASSEDDFEDEDGELDGEDSRLTSPVHVCIKNKGWDLVLGSALSTVDFRKAKVGARLLFECNAEQVERKTVEPLVYDVRPNKDGRTAAVELKIAVLSSQLEGALFTVEFTVVPLGAPKGVSLDLISEPIRVVSKKSQLEAATTQKKRSRTTQAATREVVLDAIAKMEETMSQSQRHMTDLYSQNMQQAQLIQSLLGRLGSVTGHDTLSTTTPVAEPASIVAPPRGVPSTVSLEEAFRILAQSLRSDSDQRTKRLQEIAQGWDTTTWQLFNEAYSILAPHSGNYLPCYNEEQLPVGLSDSRLFFNGSVGAFFGI